MISIFSTDSNSDKPKLIFISPDKILPNKNQPRILFDEGKLFELASSIKEHGILQPLTVKKGEGDQYELIAGERRLRAAKLIGLKQIPAIINKFSTEESHVLAIIENIQRQNLNYFEEALSYQKLIDNCNLTQDELAKKLGKTQSTIANKLRILKLPEHIKDLLTENNLTERHARCLLKLSDDNIKETAIKEIISKNLNVQQTEVLIMSMLGELRKKQSKASTTRRCITLFKDLRVFSNTINQTVDMIKKAGLPVKSNKNETDSYIEYTIRVDKDNINTKVEVS